MESPVGVVVFARPLLFFKRTPVNVMPDRLCLTLLAVARLIGSLIRLGTSLIRQS